VDGYLGGVGAGDEVGGSNEVQEFLVIDPLALTDGLALHDGDVSGRASERESPQLQEKK
jgi:hypothetical protein